MHRGKTRILALALALALWVSAFTCVRAEREETLTRGDFVIALYGLETETGGNTGQAAAFTDVPPEGELARAVAWAVDRGIVKGYGNGFFGPEDPVTREQMVTMLYRNAQALGQTPEGDWIFPLGFTDTEDIADWAEKAEEWAVMNRLLPAGPALAPKAEAAPEELADLLTGWRRFLVPEGESRGSLILFTGDVHCGIDQGYGYAGLAEMRRALTAQGYDVLLVDDGDSIQGEPVGVMTKGDAILDLMNDLGYSVAIPGNHEFDYGMEQLLSLTERADYDYVSCNLNRLGELVLRPYVLRELGGMTVAFVGVTTPESMTSSTPASFKDEEGNFIYGFFQDKTGEGVYSAVQSAVDAARAAGAERVILLAHLGNEVECTPWTYADVISHTTGVDALLDGHSHDSDLVVMKNAAGELTPRAACVTKLSSIGWCSIGWDGKLDLGLYTWYADTPAPEKLGLDNDLSKAVKEATEALDRKLDEVAAYTQVELTINDPAAVDAQGKPIRMVRRTETNLGDLCADAYRDQSGAEIALVGGGGIRVSIPKGDITLRDILNVHPFGNYLCVIEATGQQILDALEWGARAVPGELGGFLQVSGLTYEICTSIESPCVADESGMFLEVRGERRVRNVLVGGEPIDPERTYTLASSNYTLLNNGDGYTMFDGAVVLQNGVKVDNQVLIDYITVTLGGVVGEGYADPFGQGRIVIRETGDGE